MVALAVTALRVVLFSIRDDLEPVPGGSLGPTPVLGKERNLGLAASEVPADTITASGDLGVSRADLVPVLFILV